MRLFLFAIMASTSLLAFGQEGNIDLTFNQDYLTRFNQGSGISSPGFGSATRLLPDGKMMIGGTFEAYNGKTMKAVARLHPDGSLDTTFKSFFTAAQSAQVDCIALQPDGKIIIAGSFDAYGSVACNDIMRINADGTADNTFIPGAGPYILDGSESIEDVAVTADNKIIVIGNFTKFNGVTRKGILRLNADGSVDTSFGNTVGAVSADGPGIRKMAQQADGYIVIAGSFTSYNGTSRQGIARLTPDGFIDATFYPGNGMLGYQYRVWCMFIQANGKILLGGNFSGYYSGSSPNLVRINADGTRDLTFAVGTGPNITVTAISEQSDGKVIVAGAFSTYNGLPAKRLMRVNQDGSLDNAFDAGLDVSTEFDHLTVQPDDKIIVRGPFVFYKDVQKRGIARLEPQGALDYLFAPSTGAVAQSNYYFSPAEIWSIVKQPDGKKLISGNFTEYNGIPRRGIVRIHANGTIDMDFAPPSSVTGTSSIALQPDGKILVASSGSSNGITTYHVLRLNPDGSLDPDFQTGAGANGYISCILVQPDGKIIFSGDFESYNGINKNKIARLNANGSVDPTFSLYYTGSDEITFIRSTSDGKFFFRRGYQIYKINANGSQDYTFSTALPGTTEDFAVLPDGKILAIGDYPGPRRLTNEGDPDFSYTVPGIEGKMIRSLDNGKVYISDGQTLKRYYVNGTVDPTFAEGYAFFDNNYYESILGLLQDGDKMLVYGRFSEYNGAINNSMVSLESSEPAFQPLELTFEPVNSIDCQQQGTVIAEALHGMAPYTYAWQTNPLTTTATLNVQSPGVYTCVVTDAGNQTRTASLLISGPESTASAELNANLNTTSFRPGFAAMAWLDAFNDGCVATSGQLSIEFDPLLTFASSNPPATQNGNVLSWDFTDLAFESNHLMPHLQFTTLTSAAIGDSIHFVVHMTPEAGDFDPTNNTKHYTFPVINGYDPNDKAVYPIGKCDMGYIRADQKLTYTIRFQNTGNSEAINIAVVDSLDFDLDIQSVRVVGKSHPMWTEVLPNNVIKFHFDEIHLPDSTSNEVLSHGSVTFEVVSLHASPEHNTQITNRGDIYFDFNTAVLTNTVSNHIYNDENVSLEDHICEEVLGNESIVEDRFNLFPNPTTGNVTIQFGHEFTNGKIVLTDLQGKTFTSIPAQGSQATLDLSNLKNGIYLVLISQASDSFQTIIRVIKN